MSTLKTVFNKLTKEEKVELKSQKFEFALIDGISRDISKIWGDVDRARGILSGAGNTAESIGKNIVLKVDSSLESIEKAEKIAKELGVSIPEIDELKKRALNAEKAGKLITKLAESAQKNIS